MLNKYLNLSCYLVFVCIFILSLLLTFSFHPFTGSFFFNSFSHPNNQQSLSFNLREGYHRQLQEWGKVFHMSLVPNQIFPERKCKYQGEPICCSALDASSKKVIRHPLHSHCTTTKEYFPSPYEIRHMKKAEEWSKISNFESRRKALIEFIESPEEIKSATIWLERVAIRQSGNNIRETDEDREYLSRFQVIRKCPREAAHSWWEYIEPLTVHARHPFGLGECWRARDQIPIPSTIPIVSSLSVEYLLLQSRQDILGNSKFLNRNGTKILQRDLSPNAFMFDAGTSRFDSSLFWFLCVYEQVSFSFSLLSLFHSFFLSSNLYIFSSLVSYLNQFLDGNILYLNQMTFGIMFHNDMFQSIISSMFQSLQILQQNIIL